MGDIEMKKESGQTTKKHRFKKNQIIITTLALMIVIAGYLNFAGSKADPDSTNALSDAAVEENQLLELSDEDLEAQTTLEQADEILVANEEEGDELPVVDETSGEAVSEDAKTEELATEVEQSDETPGEAVMTSSAGVIANARLDREQMRSKNKETLQGIIDSTSVTEAQRQSAVDSMLRITENAQKEVAAETLLQAKGFTEVIVSITDTSVDVVVNAEALSEAQLAQIEDIVKRKTGVDGSSVVITPVSGE